MDVITLLILASKTFISVLKSDTLIVREGFKQKYVSFIRKGRATVLRTLAVVDSSNIVVTLENYQSLYRDPQPHDPVKNI